MKDQQPKPEPLGEKVVKPKPEPQPVEVRPGIWRMPDGKLETRIPVPKFDWYRDRLEEICAKIFNDAFNSSK